MIPGILCIHSGILSYAAYEGEPDFIRPYSGNHNLLSRELDAPKNWLSNQVTADLEMILCM